MEMFGKVGRACLAVALAALVVSPAASLEASAKEVAVSAAFPCTLAYRAGGAPDVLRIDLGAASAGGYAVIDVAAAKGAPVLRVAYANHPDGLGEKGCFTRETSARYLGPSVDIPVLPGNLNRHELYHIRRTGLFVAPLIQGQARYVRLQLDTPGTEVTISSFALVNAKVFREGDFAGSFHCSDDRFDRLWKISAWTCQIAAFPNHDAWKAVAGRLLPRKLEQASGEGWCRKVAPCDGTLEVEYEFDANPHFPCGRFEVLAGDRRTEVVQVSTNETLKASVPIRRGERFGLSVGKESWPVVSAMHIVADGGVRWSARFDDADGLDEWDFARTLPFVADGAKRDRLIWSGDLWWAERNIFYSFNPGDDPYMRGCVEMLGFNQTPEGYVQACPYAERATPIAKGEWGPFPSDEFAAWFVPVLYDYYLYSGDAATARRLYPKALRLMDYLAAHTAEDGTFVQRRETSKHACNLNLGDTSHRAYMDILLWKCCEDAAAMAADFGGDAERVRFAKWAERLSAAVRSRFWDDEEGFFVLSDAKRTFGFEANALALAARFATRAEALRIAPHLKRTGHGKFQALAARGLMEYGLTDRGLKVIEAHNWMKLLDPGWKGALTTTECMGMIRRGWGDESHPDTAIAGILSGGVLGIVPTAPGYSRFEFRPHPCAKISSASGRVPTPHGDIDASWRLEGDDLVVELEVPDGTVASVVVSKGGGSSETRNGNLAAGRHRFIYKDVRAGAVADPVGKDFGGDGGGKLKLSASSSHEAGGWSIGNLTAPMKRRNAKGWSTKGHSSEKAEEWLMADLGSVKAVERIELWARDDGDSRGATAGFPRTFVVEGSDDARSWRTLKSYADVGAPNAGMSFVVDLYTVIGFPKARYVRIRATELGPTATDEPDVWRMQFRRLAVVVGGN